MKALVYGHEKMYKKLAACLSGEDIEMTKADDKFYQTACPPDELYDLAIVDSHSETAEAACNYIRNEWGIPVILLVSPRQANWKGIVSMDADGYIPEAKKGSEYVARARALLRRLSRRELTGENRVYAA